VDFDAERERLRGAIKKLQDDMSGLERKLGNADFVAKAPEDVVEKQRARLDESREKIAGLEEHLKSLC
jgi:valyl-tRNA synthetase